MAVAGTLLVAHLSDREVTVPLPPPTGQRIATGLDVVVVIDDSGSTEMTDPRDRRLHATRAAVDYLATLAADGDGDRVAVCRFGSQAQRVLPLTPPAVTDEFDDALRDGRHRGQTNLVAALDCARDALGPTRPHRNQVVLLFTDGLLDADQAHLLPEFDRRLQAQPELHTHLFALDAIDSFETVLPAWQALPLSSITRIDHLDEGDLELALARTLVAELGLTWDGPR